MIGFSMIQYIPLRARTPYPASYSFCSSWKSLVSSDLMASQASHHWGTNLLLSRSFEVWLLGFHWTCHILQAISHASLGALHRVGSEFTTLWASRRPCCPWTFLRFPFGIPTCQKKFQRFREQVDCFFSNMNERPYMALHSTGNIAINSSLETGVLLHASAEWDDSLSTTNSDVYIAFKLKLQVHWRSRKCAHDRHLQ